MPTPTTTPVLTIAADYTAFIPTVGNPLTGEYATFDLTPMGSSSHALLTFYNNGNYSISNVAVLNSVVLSHPGLSISFKYTNADGFGGHASGTGVINLSADHDVITAITHPVAQSGTEGTAFTLSNAGIFADLFTQTESDTYSLAVSGLPNGLTYSAATGITGTPTVEAGTYHITVTATNTDTNEPTHLSATNTLTINVADNPHEILSTGVAGSASQIEGDVLSAGALNVASLFKSFNAAIDPVMDGVTYSVVGSLPAGLSLNSTTGDITGTITAETGLTATIKATNNDNPADVATNTIVFTIADNPHEILSTGVAGSASQIEGDVLSAGALNVASLFKSFNAAIDPVMDGVTYSVVGSLPAGLSLNSTTGDITGTITAETGLTATIKATNNDNPADVATNTIVFTIADNPHEILSTGVAGSASQIEGDVLSAGALNVASLFKSFNAAIDPVMDGVTYSVVGSLPAGLSLNSTTGDITGTITAETGLTATIKATNNDDPADVATNTIVFTIADNPHEILSTGVAGSASQIEGDVLSAGALNVASLF